MGITRTHRLNLLISDDERRKLQLLADRQGLTMSAYIRKHIREAYKAVVKAKRDFTRAQEVEDDVH